MNRMKMVEAAEVEATRAFEDVAGATSLEHVDCRRCAGSGTYILASGAPGDCFGCGGTGRCPKDRRAAERIRHQALVAYNRVMWRALRAALASAEAEAVAAPGWSVRSEVRYLRNQLAACEVAGKAAKELA